MAKVIDHKKAEKAEARKNKDTAYAGKKTYRMTEPHYRKGKYYPAGSLITVVDEKPSVTWEPVGKSDLAEDESLPAPAPKALPHAASAPVSADKGHKPKSAPDKDI